MDELIWTKNWRIQHYFPIFKGRLGKSWTTNGTEYDKNSFCTDWTTFGDWASFRNPLALTVLLEQKPEQKSYHEHKKLTIEKENACNDTQHMSIRNKNNYW